MHSTFDLALLRTFAAVVDSGSFSTAAQWVGRSQSAVSMQVQRLEQMVGRTLLVRGQRIVTPNAAGADFLIHARRLLKLSDDLWNRIAEQEEERVVRLGVPDDYAAFLLPPVLARFAAEHPRFHVHLVCEPSAALNAAIDANRIDLAIVSRMENQAIEVLRREPFVWVASPSHMAWAEEPLPVALFEQGCTARANVQKALAQQGRRHRAAYSSASLLGLTAVVQAGLAVAGLAMCSVPPALRIIGANEGLPELEHLEIAMLRSAFASSAQVDRLAEFLRRAVATRP